MKSHLRTDNNYFVQPLKAPLTAALPFKVGTALRAVRAAFGGTIGSTTHACLLMLALVLPAAQFALADEDSPSNKVLIQKLTTAETDESTDKLADEPDAKHNEVIIKKLEKDGEEGADSRKTIPWLGLATDEAPEVLTSQLGLEPGVGLVVTFVTPDSPAAKAGLQKNDVLVQLAGQSLVVPAQLRKLVRARKQGDVVELVFYRAGRKETASATLDKTAEGFDYVTASHAGPQKVRELEQQLKELAVGDAIREQMKTLKESLGSVQFDREKIQEEVRHSMEIAEKAIKDALREATNANSMLKPARKALEELQRSRVAVDNGATVTVRSSGKSARSLVKTDDSGAIVLVSNPKLHLTAHDKEGKLLFDGEIETPEQRAKVPRDLWGKVKPLLHKLESKDTDDAEPEDH
jgi:hypothetical protein